MAARGRTGIVVAAAALAAGLAGCTHSTRVYPYPHAMVWQAAIGESILWRPERIDEKRYVISATKSDPAQREEYQYEMTVRKELSFGRGPRTKVSVRIEQTKPKRRRFGRHENDFLDRLTATLDQMAQAAGG